MKIYYQNITYNFCSFCCTNCSYYLGKDWCSVFPDIRYYAGKRVYPTEQSDIFEL